MQLFLKPPVSREQFRQWWGGRAGYREVLALAGPLVLSTGSLSIQQFVDRMFLTWYSPAAMAASLPAGFLSFTFLCFFIGTASYVNTFVAQYRGAGEPQRIGPAIWQALFFSLGAALLILILVPLAAPIFRWAGHAPDVQAMECQYFRIMCYGGGFVVYSSAISGFFTGLSRTWTVMWVNVAATLLNVALDYAWIFGHWGFPRAGVAGAAWATVAASIFSALSFTVCFLARQNRRLYATHRPVFDRALFTRLMRFGLPSGMQFMLDVLSFSLFVLLVGRIGTRELGASNLAFQINSLAWLPMIGFSVATTTLVGQSLGENRPDLAARATWSAFHMTLVYMSVVALLYVLVPSIFLDPFAAGAAAGEFAPLRALATLILRFVALYSVFDTMNIIIASALKGAGDTRFVMIASLAMGWVMMVIPTWWASRPGGGGIWLAWTSLTLYIIAMGFVFLARFLQGKWVQMRVIEPAVAPALPVYPLPAGPAAAAELES